MDKNVSIINKKYIVQALINRIEKENEHGKIKTSLVDGYAEPEKIVKKENAKEGYIPDVISETNGKTDLYEVEMNDQEYSVEKWRLFSQYSIQSKGSLNIVVPEKQLDSIKSILKENKISARIIYYA
jgi:hypothetical protein